MAEHSKFLNHTIPESDEEVQTLGGRENWHMAMSLADQGDLGAMGCHCSSTVWLCY